MSSEFPLPLHHQQGTGQNVAYTTAARSTQLGAQTYAVRVQSTSACHIRFGDVTVVAVSTDALVNAGAPGETIGCAPKQYISVVQDSAGGTLNIVELTR